MKEFTVMTLKEKISESDALNLYARLKRRRLGTYKMCTYSNSRCKSILQSVLHFNIDECLNSSLCEEDKKFLHMLKNLED